MKVLITGGAGFIGRWVSKKFIEEEHEVFILDDLSNGSEKNIEEFKDKVKFTKGDIKDKELLENLFKEKFDLCVHLAAAINVQESIENPEKDFQDNVLGTFYLLEECRKNNTKFVFASTGLVYDSGKEALMDENYPVKPASPYAASKIAAENLVLGYYHSYKLPTTVLRPFNIYGPFQKSNMEGGVVSIFIQKNLEGKDLEIFGDGTQSRDFLYVEDCADFVYKASVSEKVNGMILNAGSGKETKINELAETVCKDKEKIKHIEHHHPQAEIYGMRADSKKAKELLDWEPSTSLEQGIKKTQDWIKGNEK